MVRFLVTDGASTVVVERALSTVVKLSGQSQAAFASAFEGADSANPEAGAVESPALPKTGSNDAAAITAAAVLILLGLMLVPVARRRRS